MKKPLADRFEPRVVVWSSGVDRYLFRVTPARAAKLIATGTCVADSEGAKRIWRLRLVAAPPDALRRHNATPLSIASYQGRRYVFRVNVPQAEVPRYQFRHLDELEEPLIQMAQYDCGAAVRERL